MREKESRHKLNTVFIHILATVYAKQSRTQRNFGNLFDSESERSHITIMQ